MASKSKSVKAAQSKKDQRLGYWLIAIPVIAFIIKLITMSNIQGGIWPGADAENYLKGTDAILKDGLFSKEGLLSYWPAGYPILIWLLAKISLTHVLWLLGFSQSIFYAYASYFFTNQLRDTKLSPYLFWIAIIITLNPTLSLSSLAIGYESPIAACMLMVAGLIIKAQRNAIDRHFWLRVASAGAFSALATFMQPRWLLTTIVIAAVWAIAQKSRKTQALILIMVIGIMAIAPVSLMARNSKAGNGAIVSTNLNVALAYGTGSTTSGGYQRSGDFIKCGDKDINSVAGSGAAISCATKWYLTNPLRTIELTLNKTRFFWSPWFGPAANGTMARNPWIKIDPLVSIAKQSKQGQDLIFGTFGKLLSWLFIAANIALLFIGYLKMRKIGENEKFIGAVILAPVLVSWISAIATLGDHRFRIPTMSLSLVLQVVGFLSLKNRRK